MRYLLGFILTLIFIFLVTLVGRYWDCKIDHFYGFHLFSSREDVREACFNHLNPFSL